MYAGIILLVSDICSRSQARMCGEPSSPADRARSRRRRRCASSRRISDLSVNAPRRPHRRCSASNLCGRGNFARSGCRSAAGGEAVDDVLGAVTAIPLIWGSDGRLERNRKFVDSPLEGDGFELLLPRHESPRFSDALRLITLAFGPLPRWASSLLAAGVVVSAAACAFRFDPRDGGQEESQLARIPVRPRSGIVVRATLAPSGSPVG